MQKPVTGKSWTTIPVHKIFRNDLRAFASKNYSDGYEINKPLFGLLVYRWKLLFGILKKDHLSLTSVNTSSLEINHTSEMLSYIFTMESVLALRQESWSPQTSKIVLIYFYLLVNKPVLVPAKSVDNARSWESFQKVNTWPGSEASRATLKSWGRTNGK